MNHFIERTFYLAPLGAWSVYINVYTSKSHKGFLTKCHKERVILQGLSIYIEPSTANQDDGKFLETWQKFCNKTIKNVSEGIDKTKIEPNWQLNNNEREKIF